MDTLAIIRGEKVLAIVAPEASRPLRRLRREGDKKRKEKLTCWARWRQYTEGVGLGLKVVVLLLHIVQSKTLVKVVHRMCTFPCKSGTSRRRPMYVKLGQADVCNIVKLVPA